MSGPLPSRVYPLTPNPVDDDRFILGLHLDVAAVLAEHGYPPLGPLDITDLGQALYRFLYVGRGWASVVRIRARHPPGDPSRPPTISGIRGVGRPLVARGRTRRPTGPPAGSAR